MNKIFLFIFLICYLIIPMEVHSQKGWEKRSPQVVKDLNDVYFINEYEGWIVGSSGTILHTVDGGFLWEVQPTTTNYFLQSIWFQNDSSGWIVGNAGIMLSTTKKGKSWTKHDPPLTTDYIDMMFSDADNGWIVGNEGIILHTTDGGQHWQYQYAGVQEAILSVSFSDANNGWLAGTYSNGWLSHTINGGTDWVNFSQPMEDLTYDIFFISPYRGWFGSEGIVYFTDDVGETWSERTLPDGAGRVVDMFFINDTLGWVITGNQIFATTDAGLTWIRQLGLESLDYFTAIFFTDPQHGWVVGSKGLVYATSDGGGMGLDELDISEQMLLYPNPGAGYFTLRLRDHLPGNKPFRIELFELSGKLINRDYSPLQEEYRFNLEGIAGTVLLRISRDGMSGSRVIILR
ncbi:MAG: hypothetical protein KBB71_00520 [Lentimicrobiaceae bacterium]|nr:hypothetical protein [Lentimicrobiaceae bacterium]